MSQMYVYGVGPSRLDRALEFLGKSIGFILLTLAGIILGYLIAMQVIGYQISHVTCHSVSDGSVVCINQQATI